MRGIRNRLAESLHAFRQAFGNPNLRRIELAWSASIIGHWAYGIALAVYAFNKGGPTAVGVVMLLRMLPSAVTSPFAGALGDRYRREYVMLAANLGRVVGLIAAASAIYADSPAPVVYALAVLVAMMHTAFRPAQAALLPSLARTPEELTAANVASSSIEAVGIFVGPALGGLLLAVTSTATVFLVTAATFLWSAFLISRIRAPEAAAPEARERKVVYGIFGGFRAIGGEPRLRLLVGLFAAQTFVAGALNVLVVVTALDLLDLGNSGVGFLNSALGVGGLLGALGAVALVGERRLAGGFGLGIILWGIPIALIGAFPHASVVLVLLAFIGLGNTIVDVAGFTLLQRTVPDELLGRVFGVVQSVFVATIGIGAALAPAFISWLGIRGALLATGALLPFLTGLFWRQLRELDAEVEVPAERLELLRKVPFLAPLAPPTVEHLAATLVPVMVPAGTEVFRQGDHGDRFYVIVEGEAGVVIDGRETSRLGAGDYFGEIALLRDVPRTATIIALTPLELYALERDEFLAAVTGHAPSTEAAEAVVGARLGTARTGVASV